MSRKAEINWTDPDDGITHSLKYMNGYTTCGQPITVKIWDEDRLVNCLACIAYVPAPYRPTMMGQPNMQQIPRTKPKGTK